MKLTAMKMAKHHRTRCSSLNAPNMGLPEIMGAACKSWANIYQLLILNSIRDCICLITSLQHDAVQIVKVNNASLSGSGFRLGISVYVLSCVVGTTSDDLIEFDMPKL